MKHDLLKRTLLSVMGMLAGATVITSCNGKKEETPVSQSNIEQAALETYVPPGKLDEFYMFTGNGHSGNVGVYGIPSMRLMVTIPVFTPYPATGYGFDKESKEMLGGYTWGDIHHPSISETNGDYDGRWLFVTDEANNRMARIDLRDFKTKQILGPLPNISGDHCSSFATENTEYLLSASRFSIPLPKGTFEKIEDYTTKYKGIVAGIAVDPGSGEMSLGWQVMTPPFQFDYGATGKGPSKDWAFWSTYNSERATGKLEVTTAKNAMDYAFVVNWKAAEKAIQDGKFKMIGGAKVIDPKVTHGVAYVIPVAKSPHGIDVSPDGKYIIVPGKLAPIATVFSFEKMLTAIQNKDFIGDEDGIPVLNPNSVKVAEIKVGPGSLHTQFDDKGYAYTSTYGEGKGGGTIVKWKLGTWEIVDKLQVNYNIGHLAIGGSDSKHPGGKYMVALNKTGKDGQHLNVGPMEPKSLQLIDISGRKMKLLYDAFTDPETHFAQIIPANKLKPIQFYPKAENKNPKAIWDPKDAKIVRNGKNVEVYMTAIMSSFTPNAIEVNKGDKVTLYITNIEQDRDESHGFAIDEYNMSVVIEPGETKTVEFTAGKQGVFPFYCTVFCSPLHEEMQGNLLVKDGKNALSMK
jgi:nitrous-oxide reductase